jgi:hypothetical protein
MKKFITILFFIILWSIICLCGGYFIGKKLTKPVIIQGETIWKDKIIYRDYAKMPVAEKDKKLKCYDQGEFFLTFKPIEEDKYRIQGNLCEREAYKDIEIEIGESGNFKLYLGFGVAVLACATIFAMTR